MKTSPRPATLISIICFAGCAAAQQNTRGGEELVISDYQIGTKQSAAQKMDPIEIDPLHLEASILCLRFTDGPNCHPVLEIKDRSQHIWEIEEKNKVEIEGIPPHTGSKCPSLRRLKLGQELKIRSAAANSDFDFYMSVLDPGGNIAKDVKMKAHSAGHRNLCASFLLTGATGTAYLHGSDQDFDYYVYLVDSRSQRNPNRRIKDYLIEIFDKSGSNSACDRERPSEFPMLCRWTPDARPPNNGEIVLEKQQGDAGGGAERPPPGR